jgi:hypothetical protein
MYMAYSILVKLGVKNYPKEEKYSQELARRSRSEILTRSTKNTIWKRLSVFPLRRDKPVKNELTTTKRTEKLKEEIEETQKEIDRINGT